MFSPLDFFDKSFLPPGYSPEYHVDSSDKLSTFRYYAIESHGCVTEYQCRESSAGENEGYACIPFYELTASSIRDIRSEPIDHDSILREDCYNQVESDAWLLLTAAAKNNTSKVDPSEKPSLLLASETYVVNEDLGVSNVVRLSTEQTKRVGELLGTASQPFGLAVYNTDMLMFIIREELMIFDDCTLARQRQEGKHGFASVGMACLDPNSVRVLF